MSSPIKAEHERVSDKLKITQLESKLELLGHAAQQVIGTAQGSFWLGRDRMSVSAYTINQLRKLVGYEWNGPAGRWAPGEVADIVILRDQLAKALGDRDAWKKESDLLREEKRVAEGKAKQFQSASEHWYAENDAAQTKLKAVRAELAANNKRVDALNDEANAIAVERNRLQVDLDDAKSGHDSIKRAFDVLKLANDAMKAERDKLKAELETADGSRVINSLNATNKDLRERIERQRKTIEGRGHSIETLQSDIKSLQADKEALRKTVKSLQEANDTLSRASGGPDAGQLRDEIAKLKLRLDAAAATIKNVDIRNAKLVGDLAKANERIAMLKANLANAGNQLLAVAKA